jgi:hypothetical protein
VVVEAYAEMQRLERSGMPFSKSDFRRRVEEQCPGRSRGSIEYKFQNVSAILDESGLAWIEGYKPARNYQKLLAEEVAAFLTSGGGLKDKPEPPTDRTQPVPDPSSSVVAAPPASEAAEAGRAGLTPTQASKIDYASADARNRSLGLAGEAFVVELERARLQQANRPDLAAKVRHVAEEDGDGLGYDVSSFTTGGEPIYIEVKTTRSGPNSPFFMSPAEFEFAEKEQSSYRLARVFNWGERPLVFELTWDRLSTLKKEPHLFRCRL